MSSSSCCFAISTSSFSASSARISSSSRMRPRLRRRCLRRSSSSWRLAASAASPAACPGSPAEAGAWAGAGPGAWAAAWPGPPSPAVPFRTASAARPSAPGGGAPGAAGPDCAAPRLPAGASGGPGALSNTSGAGAALASSRPPSASASPGGAAGGPARAAQVVTRAAAVPQAGLIKVGAHALAGASALLPAPVTASSSSPAEACRAWVPTTDTHSPAHDHGGHYPAAAPLPPLARHSWAFCATRQYVPSRPAVTPRREADAVTTAPCLRPPVEPRLRCVSQPAQLGRWADSTAGHAAGHLHGLGAGGLVACPLPSIQRAPRASGYAVPSISNAMLVFMVRYRLSHQSPIGRPLLSG